MSLPEAERLARRNIRGIKQFKNYDVEEDEGDGELVEMEKHLSRVVEAERLNRSRLSPSNHSHNQSRNE